jgi:hypothetical protein
VRRSVCVLAATALLGVGCGDQADPAPKQPELPTGPGQVSGSGFVTRQPAGYNGAGTGEPSGVVLTLLGPFRGTTGKPPTIIVARSPRLPTATPRRLRSVLRDQVEGMGGEKVKTLPDRQIDGDPAVGVASRRTASGGDETVERSYRVVHADAIYSVASTVLVRDANKGERALETVLDGWRWTR